MSNQKNSWEEGNPEDLNRLKIQEDITKLRLEKLKLEKDILTYDKRLQLEEKRARNDGRRFIWETIRLLGVALITGFITLFGYSYQVREGRKSAIHNEFLAACKEFGKLKQNSQEKYEKACDICGEFETYDIPEIKLGLTKYIILCEVARKKENSETAQSNLTGNGMIGDKSSDKIDSMENRQKILRSKSQKGLSTQEKQELVVLETKLEKITDSLHIKDISRQSDKFTNDIVQQTNEFAKLSVEATAGSGQVTRKMAEGYPRTSWFKPGYFLPFDHMKIMLLELDEDSEWINVNICLDNSTRPCPVFKLKDRKISNREPLVFDEGGYQYIISLDHIGKAGKNPFNKAAYITFSKYIK